MRFDSAAHANRHVFSRNDKELVCASLTPMTSSLQSRPRVKSSSRLISPLKMSGADWRHQSGIFWNFGLSSFP